MKKTLTLLFALCSIALCANAQTHKMLIPEPQEITSLSNKTTQVKTVTTDISPKYNLPKEGYILTVKGKKATIKAADTEGVIWAKVTLKQLKDQNGEYPEIEITDYPEFPIRGFMHDSGRNFMEIDMIKDYIDLMSQYKLNVFHWHLTDYPAWRIESHVYPILNSPEFHRVTRDPGRFYTYDQIRDVIAYAKAKGIMVMPEIDMPGHSGYFKRAFNTSMDSPEGMKILEKLIAEFMKEIPKELCPYLHIGSDEVYIKDPKGFMKWSEDLCAKYDRQAVAWDPGLPAEKTTIRQIWNEASGANSAATAKTGPFLDSFMGYLNYYDPITYTSRNILHNPCATGVKTENALGGILCMWNDVRVIDKTKFITHNGVLSAMLAFSERFWTGGNLGHKGNTNVLPNPKSEVGMKLKAFEDKLIYHRDNILQTPIFRWVANSHIPWKIEIPEAGKTVETWGGAIDMDAICSSIDFKSTDSTFAIATTKIFAQKDTTIYAWVGFEATARSNRIGNGIGEQGKWETDSQIFVNGQEVNPPHVWNEPGKYNFKFHTWHKAEEEFAYTDEQFYWTRTPARIVLKKGENTVKLISRKTFKDQRWSFAFIPLSQSLDGSVSEPIGIQF